jgi:hypothetical protein
MKVLCPSCERLVELVDLRVEKGGLLARCPACGAEQRQQLPAPPVTLPSPKAGAKASGKKRGAGKKKEPERPAPAEGEDDEGPTILLLTSTSDAVPLAVAPPAKNASGKKKEPGRPPADASDESDEGQTIILLTSTSDAVPLAVAPPGAAAPSRPAEVSRFESGPKPPAVAPLTAGVVGPAQPPKRVVDAEFAQLLDQLGNVQPSTPLAAQVPSPLAGQVGQALRPRNTGATPVVPPPQPGVTRGSTIQIPPGHCPKCITPRAPQSLICNACGLVFANFRAEEHQPSAALESAWRALEDRWAKQDEHEKFLQMAFNMDELAKAGRLYRIRLAAVPDDAQAKVALESMVRMASTAAAAAAKTDPAELQRNRRKVLAVSAMLFFVIPIAALLVNFLLKAK